MSDIDVLKRKRAVIKSTLTRFANYINALTPEDDLRELKGRTVKGSCLLERFDEVQTEIEILDDSEVEAQERERAGFENNYYAVLASAEALLDTLQTPSSAPLTVQGQGSDNAVSVTNLNLNDSVRLPTLNLPKFDGSYENWTSFKDTFEALVNNNANLSDVQKFYYLRGSLQAKAAETIESLQISNNNYTIAWNLLTERFENKKLTIFAHIKAIIEIPSLIKENAVALRHLFDEYLKSTRALKNLGEPVDSWSSLLIYIISQKFDYNTRKLWESEAKGNNIPRLTELENFLKQRCQLLEIISNKNTESGKRLNKVTTIVAQSNSKLSCYYCNNNHTIFKCDKFKGLSLHSRQTEVTRLGLCQLCLGKNHKFLDCKARPCYKCKLKHNGLLHSNDKGSDDQSHNSERTESASKEKIEVISGHVLNEGQVLLQTANVLILNSNAQWVRARALLDSGSTANYITEKLAIKLGLAVFNAGAISIAGVNGTNSEVSKFVTSSIRSLIKVKNFETKLSFLVLEKITEKIPLVNIDTRKIKIPTTIQLADENFHTSNHIDLLIGAQIFFELITDNKIESGTVILRESKLGWLLTGSIAMRPAHGCFLSIGNNTVIQNLLERFWKVEEFPHEKILTPEQTKCEEIFESETQRDSKGRFIVKYPTDSEVLSLGDSFTGALSRFYKLEKRLNNDRELRQQYNDFLYDYEKAGHMQRVFELNLETDISTVNDNNNEKYYIPHHAVQKIGSSTTSLRVVFDASARSSNGVSLNQILQNGPIVQSDLFSILLRFRKHAIVLSADVKQMFRQVLVDNKQCDLQRIIWRFDPEKPLAIYRLKTITYGLKPATYLATRCLVEIASNFEKIYPKAAKAIIEDTYVDDFTSGANNVREALLLKEQVDEILSAACFQLRKWRSNSQELLINTKFISSSEKHFFKDDTELKTLGLVWDSNLDTLRFGVNEIQNFAEMTTKRTILSLVAKIFDPMGLVGPCIIRAKIFLQKLWLQRINWDELISPDLAKEWLEIKEQIFMLKLVSMPRRVMCESIKLELHAFSDASEKAYGCCIYVKSITNLEEGCVRLLCSKSRVAPLQKLTLPKLELSAAVLLAKLVSVVHKEMKLSFSSVTCWTDSSIVLNWISAHASNWKIFVGNRVACIQNLTKGYIWRHVRSEDNPADILSRGMKVDDLNNSIWWSGPNWLAQDPSLWPKSKNEQLKLVEIPEQKRANITLTSTNNFDLINRFSSFKRLRNVTAWCLRFTKRTKIKLNNFDNFLSLEEIKGAENLLIRLAQDHSFHVEIETLRKNKELGKTSSILSLNPFLDTDNVLRVGGRLVNSELDYNKKHPIILPRNHMLTKLIIKHEHLKNLHLGAQGLLAVLRERYWIVKGMSTIKGVLRTCLVCFKFNPKVNKVMMGNLPKNRIMPTRPFLIVSLDYGGPILVKESKFRNKRIIKTYICIFVCFSTKAVHIELVSDLSSEAFLNSLKRFVSRRGLPKEIHSDNATNFVRSNKDLSQIHSNLSQMDGFMKDYLLETKITWKFIPPNSPHFGGLHESAIKSAKGHLKRVMHGTTFTVESLNTILCQIESILNSRPLYPISNDPQDLSALTPAHFIIGEPMTALPQQNMNQIVPNRRNLYQELQKRTQSFWARWSKDYISNLQLRTKWKQGNKNNVREGDLVLLKDENLPSQCWRLGRITNLHHGRDGLIRVVDLKTATGTTSRAINRVCPIPLEDPQDFNGGSMDETPLSSIERREKTERGSSSEGRAS